MKNLAVNLFQEDLLALEGNWQASDKPGHIIRATNTGETQLGPLVSTYTGSNGRNQGSQGRNLLFPNGSESLTTSFRTISLKSCRVLTAGCKPSLLLQGLDTRGKLGIKCTNKSSIRQLTLSHPN